MTINARVVRLAIAGGCTALTLMTAACGYRIVKRSDVTARTFAADSATMRTLEQQIATIEARCRADSARLAGALAARASVAPAPAPASTADSIVRARDTEIATLREQLTRANAELERIKKRLANPRS